MGINIVLSTYTEVDVTAANMLFTEHSNAGPDPDDSTLTLTLTLDFEEDVCNTGSSGAVRFHERRAEGLHGCIHLLHDTGRMLIRGIRRLC